MTATFTASIAILLTPYLFTVCVGDIDSGCPFWGCLPWGSFSLSADIPSQGQVKWATLIDQTDQEEQVNHRGCVSDQQTVVCATHSGYVSIDPSNGKQLWNYTTKATPFLPIMDIYGDVIGMDGKAMYYVGADGKPKQPISVGILKPTFSLMVANNSIMIIAATTNKTAQIVTYGTDGIVDGAIPLDASVEQMNGTFIPCSQPIIAGSRAYLMTYFFPDDIDDERASEVTGAMRLYAIDLLHQMAPRIKVAWYFNFGRWSHYPRSGKDDSLNPIVTYFNNTVYVNVPGNLFTGYYNKGHNSNNYNDDQPYPGTLWAVQDMGSDAKQVFRTSSFYGNMAVFDTYTDPNPIRATGKGSSTGSRRRVNSNHTKTSPPHSIWIANPSPSMLAGYDAVTGSTRNVTGLNDIFQQLGGWITSRLSITRSPKTPDADVIVFGMSDQNGLARLVAVEISSQGVAKLRMNVVVGKPTTPNNSLVVSGQIVNFALSYMETGNQGPVNWKLGLVAMVTEMGTGEKTNTTAVAVM